jgi:hypothetical protein
VLDVEELASVVRNGSVRGNLIAAVKQAMLHAFMRDALTEREARKAQLQQEVAAAPQPAPVIQPTSPSSTGARWTSCTTLCEASSTRLVFVPQGRPLAIYLYGELGAILALTNDKATSGRAQLLLCPGIL